MVGFSNINNNWGEIAVAREKPENMGTVAAHQEFTIFTLRKGEKETFLKGILFVTE